MSVNQVILSGNVVAQPELRFGKASGAAVANFTIAHTPRKFDKERNDWVDGETLWQDVVAFKNLAETITENLGKGQPVVVVGNLTQENWSDKDTGVKRSKHVLVASDVSLGVKRVKAEQSTSNPANAW